MNKFKLIQYYHYNDTSWGGRVPSTFVKWLSPGGRVKEDFMYGVGFLTKDQIGTLLSGKYSRRLTNLFGLVWYI